MKKMLNLTITLYLILVMLPVSFYSQKPGSDSVDGTFTKPVTNANFQENKEDWTFYWSENEYVVDIGSEFIHLALEKAGIRRVYYESPGTSHEWQTWRRSLYQLAALIFKD